MLRIIAGSARGVRLMAPEGMGTRPTADRLKENLFNILSPQIPGARFLDLFSGSGAIGIEALSRAAESAVFIEESRKAMRVIRENLAKAKLNDRAELLNMSVRQGLNELSSTGRTFDIIFLDPPYQSSHVDDVLYRLGGAGLLTPDGLIVAELPASLTPRESDAFELMRVKVYGEKKFMIWGTRT
jgi:16S rRNA (guanine(966)-N(2))-methyltransferase RsmD